MRVFIADQHGCVYPDLGFQIKSAFEALGHETNSFNYRYKKLHHLPPANWLMNKMMLRRVLKWKPDLFLGHKGETILPEIVNNMKKAGIKTVNWSSDEPFGEVQAHHKVSNIAEYDYFFIYDPMYLERLKAINPNSFHLPAGADPFGVHKEQITLEERKFPADIGMVGTAYKNRIDLVKPFADKQMRLAGPGWDKVPELASKAIPPVSIIEMVRLFNESKINLNPHGHGLMVPNPRTFEIPASRSFELVNYREEFKEFFKEGKELVMYKDEKEFKELVEYYLANNDERLKITQAGYDRVVKDHTIKARIETLLKTMKL